MGIPVTLLGTLFLLPLFGVYLDSIALAAMIIVIGIIVDDGIIVAENIWHHRELGYSPLEAALEGMSSVFQPVLTTLLTTGLAFAPMFFMPGVMGDFVFVIPLVVVLALFISLCEVTMALPAHLIAGLPEGPLAIRRENQGFVRVEQAFGHFVTRALALRYPVVGGFLLLLFASCGYASRYMDFVLFPTPSADGFYMLVELPNGSSLEHTSDKIRALERLVEKLPQSEF
jgi:multidrug efflux pump subunit AcrB